MAVDHIARAARAWDILVELAGSARETMTYGALARQIGIHHRPIRYALDPIQQYCLQHELPRLTALVVSASTGLQGPGFAGTPGDQDDMRAVRDFAWRDVVNPFANMLSDSEVDDFADQLRTNPASARTVYYLLPNRGARQRVFRRAVFKAYGGRCAICRTTFEEMLEAAHIDRWCSTDEHRRIDPRNGILLCANHHKLFDAGWLSVSEDYRVKSFDPKEAFGPYTEADTAMLTRYQNAAIVLPRSSALYPDKALLARRFATSS